MADALAQPGYNHKLILLTDACDEVVGVYLCQTDEETGNGCIIAYYSRALNDHERAYTISEKVALAVVVAVKHLLLISGSVPMASEIYLQRISF